jgi:ABC-2 type transport system permease protein
MLLAELRSLFRRTLVIVLLVVLFAIPVLLAVAVYVSGGPSDGQGPNFLDRVSHNGVFAALAGLTVCIPFFLPLTVAVVAGDTIAGEASLGTLRYLLARPSGRLRLLAVKGVTVVVFALAAGLVVVIGGLLAGAVFFPVGPVIGLSGTSLSLFEGILRCLLAAVIVAASLLGVGAIGVFVSTLVNTPIPATVITVGAVVTSLVADGVPQLGFLHPWLFSHNWLAFGDLFRSPVTWHSIDRDLVLQLAYVAVFGTAAWARFTTRDILA